MKTVFAVAMITVLPAGFSPGQDSGKDSAPASPEMAAVAANDRAYEAAYAKADIKALVDFYTDDVSYTADDGRVFNGKAAIESCFTAAFATSKGGKIAINLDTVKVLAPDVVVENGSTMVIPKDGEESSAMFTAIHVKKDGKWKISQLVETPAASATPAEHLAELSWLMGDWKEADKEAGVTVQSHYLWARGGNFITRNITVKRGDNPVIEGWQVIGWNPVDECIRSWTFDDAGGFTEGRWTRDGERWLVREAGYDAGGGRTSADNTLTKAGDDKVFWESSNRTLDGDPQPGIGRIEITRSKGE